MKKKILLVGAVIASTFSFSQTPVSQSVSKKNVILEEFTGIHCVNCPDGHKTANQISAANPGRVVLVNYHTGSYATPSAGELNLSTPNGATIANWEQISGYPSGSISRIPYDDGYGLELGFGRGSWSTAASTILVDDSPVNIAMDASIDGITRLVTVKVEIFYTSPFASGTNHRLNVGILQDNIAEYQTGASYNSAQILPNGKYNHLHVFRKFVNASGASGDIIDASSTGVITKTFTYTLPADINAIPLKIGDLKLFAFVHAGMNGISNSEAYNAIEVTPTKTNYVGLSEISNATEFSVYPNPASDKLNVSFKAENVDYTINISDLSGRVILSNTYSKLSNNQSIELPLTGISSGNYIVSVSSVNGTVNQHVAIK